MLFFLSFFDFEHQVNVNLQGYVRKLGSMGTLSICLGKNNASNDLTAINK